MIYVRPGQASFDMRSYKLTTLAVESFGHLGKSRTPTSWLATSVVARADDGNLRVKAVVKERLQHIIYVAAVDISRRVELYRLALGARREARQKASTPLPSGYRSVNGGSCATQSPD